MGFIVDFMVTLRKDHFMDLIGTLVFEIEALIAQAWNFFP